MDPARVHAVAAGAWLVAYKLAFDRSDLDLATIGFRTAYESSPTPCRASNLASCLLELTDFDGNRTRCVEALTLLDVATSDPEATVENRSGRIAGVRQVASGPTGHRVVAGSDATSGDRLAARLLRGHERVEVDDLEGQ